MKDKKMRKTFPILPNNGSIGKVFLFGAIPGDVS